MENNGDGRVAAGFMHMGQAADRPPPKSSRVIEAQEGEDASQSRVVSVFLSSSTIEKDLNARLRNLRNYIDSPKSLLILKNAFLTELEVYGTQPLQKKSAKSVCDAKFVVCMLSDVAFREKIVDMLISTTPAIWDESWNHSWSKDAEPIYTEKQQRILRRRSLINFWTKELDSLPAEQVRHAIQIASVFAKE
jgi:hypothetical protein